MGGERTLVLKGTSLPTMRDFSPAHSQVKIAETMEVSMGDETHVAVPQGNSAIYDVTSGPRKRCLACGLLQTESTITTG